MLIKNFLAMKQWKKRCTADSEAELQTLQRWEGETPIWSARSIYRISEAYLHSDEGGLRVPSAGKRRWESIGEMRIRLQIRSLTVVGHFLESKALDLDALMFWPEREQKDLTYATRRDAVHYEGSSFRRKFEVEERTINEGPFKTVERFFEIQFEHKASFRTLSMTKMGNKLLDKNSVIAGSTTFEETSLESFIIRRRNFLVGEDLMTKFLDGGVDDVPVGLKEVGVQSIWVRSLKRLEREKGLSYFHVLKGGIKTRKIKLVAASRGGRDMFPVGSEVTSGKTINKIVQSVVGNFDRISDPVILSVLEIRDFISATSIENGKVKKTSVSIPLLKPIDTGSHAPIVFFNFEDFVKLNPKVLFKILKKTTKGIGMRDLNAREPC
ncbi:hypothetical protein FXO38_03518 [Capsicum annuum]|nr:hypothetical protein FXO37_28294 [Capsicum annuum]KAF3677983.1 hypothetical protein FXO38_03518 [Capsicum annuum]